MPTATSIVTCKQCGIQVQWSLLRKHHKEMHGSIYKKKDKEPQGVSERYSKIRTDLKELLLDIDNERNKLQQRVLELDDLAVKYKQLL